jgi:putative two-component system response regulator
VRGAGEAVPPPGDDPRRACILAVDDENAVLTLMGRQLAAAGYTRFHSETDAAAVPRRFRELAPDLVVVDLDLAGASGLDVIESLKPIIDESGTYLPILMVSGNLTTEARRRALAGGARDYLSKPYDAGELVLRVRNLLEMRFLHAEVRTQNRQLEEKVRERTVALDRSRIDVLERLARAGEYRDDDTGQHTRRVGEISARIGRALGMDESRVHALRLVAPLHDLGKIGIPDAILLKPGRLTPAERACMETHTTIGGAILSRSVSPMLEMAEQIALTHHEWWDGRGYPAGLAGTQIPLEARVVAVADVSDALSHDRPYRGALPWSVVQAELEQGAGNHFDPDVVRCFLGLGA